MISSRKNLLLAGLLASATFCSAGAFAQAPSAPGVPAAETQSHAGPAAQHRHMDPAQRMERMQAHRAKRMADLKLVLQITPAQESAWQSFTAAQQPPARPAGAARFDRAEFAKLTTPQRLDRIQARQAERSAMFAKRAEATRNFYAALSPVQQKIFDVEAMHFAGHGRGGHMGHMGHAGNEAPAHAKG
ncbi:hypothetical protein SRS16CHR_00012 [Variovorax sp. SRS16]|uniref:Spy/CpxP family protein refolding chaperone n=1 Tax=Variovorax sp. SRS16 TaxID=282217 RepID=UPI001319AB56|nr:Spy/CpxP family protein refolding chaperone [Variovorax sp. SRS16]VTU12773.1 hypothetical protein SRS16CHR_00012 [Variovorax sp. SRS16]